MSDDPVNHPRHYTDHPRLQNAIECIGGELRTGDAVRQADDHSRRAAREQPSSRMPLRLRKDPVGVHAESEVGTSEELWMSSHGECSEPPQGPSFHERVRIRESARTPSGAPTFGTGPGTHLGDGISPRPTPSSRGGSASQERRPSGQPARELGAVEQEPTGGGASRRPSGVGDTDSGALRTGPTDHDPVNKPQHYRSHASGVECIQITEHMGFCLGNAVKYIWRADLKGDAIEDLEKARWYLDREIGRRYRAEVPGCSCGICAPGFIGMRLCRTCGDKRCIGALDHRKHKGTADV